MKSPDFCIICIENTPFLITRRVNLRPLNFHHKEFVSEQTAEKGGMTVLLLGILMECA